MAETIKLFPKSIESIDFKSVSNENIIKSNIIGFDEDKDEWDLCQSSCIKIDNLSLDCIENLNINKNDFNTDLNTLLTSLFKSRKINLKNQKIIVLDTIESVSYIRHNNIGSEMLGYLETKFKDEGFKAIVLKAHPIITWKHGLIPNKNKKEIKEEKELIQKFYLKNGYRF